MEQRSTKKDLIEVRLLKNTTIRPNNKIYQKKVSIKCFLNITTLALKKENTLYKTVYAAFSCYCMKVAKYVGT